MDLNAYADVGKRQIKLDINEICFQSFVQEDTFIQDPEGVINALIREVATLRKRVQERDAELRESREHAYKLQGQVNHMVAAVAVTNRLKASLEAVVTPLYQIIDAIDLDNSTMERQAVSDLARTIHNWIIDELVSSEYDA